MFKGKEKRPKHMQESQFLEIHDFAIKIIVSVIARLVSGIALKLIDKYFF